MIKISINGNRSDIAGYISYYSVKDLAPILDVKEEEIVYETQVVDYFKFGDINMDPKVEVLVTIDQKYIDNMMEISDVLAKYVSGFVSEFNIRFEVIDSRLTIPYKVENEHACMCEDEDCKCHCDDCESDEHECDCNKEGHTCHCHDKE